MVINFCDPILKPRIRCNAVTVDGYDVTNLCSVNPSLRNKGLLVESYIKPPISVIVHLPVNIEIRNVIICTAVGAQRSCGLELYAHSQQRTSSWISNQECGEDSRSGVSFPSDSDVNRVYCCIGRAHDDQAQYIDFINSKYREDVAGGALPQMPKHSLYGSVRTSEVHAKYHRYLNNVSHIVIRITRAISSSACALRWVEIWGQPSHTCKASWHHAIHDLCWKEFSPKVRQDSGLECNNFQSERKLTTDICDLNEQFDELPEEFIDPLTQEMMLMPVLLPCGKTIDQTSLDRYVKQLSQWGHSPNDPYTGKEFTEHEKPIPNAALKARMDRFLLHHPDVASKVDFRVGRNTGIFSVSCVTQSKLASKTACHLDVASCTGDVHQDLYRPAKRLCSDSSQSNRGKRTCISVLNSGTDTSSSKYIKVKTNCAVSTTLSLHPVNTTPSLHAISTTQSSHLPSAIQSSHSVSTNPSMDHSQNSQSTPSTTSSTSSDLDTVLQLTLANLPRFSQKTSSRCESTDPECVYCRKCVDFRCLYMLECSHLLCKQCLLERLNGLECGRCGQITQRSDVVKAHF
ncbi:hypothetical protein LSH36_43g07032 [Paralvinella palmiformis]|uniref:U-box domain-containing protein n=1 Tax=Paralvinella palmiformis TaxID=53620 RepID=A0AAD9K6Z6_9ANNE|nr:hypothetical protein LSH36_43g07032 [Paralvinella palmiformis]